MAINDNLNERLKTTTDPKEIKRLMEEAKRAANAKPSIEEEAAALKAKNAASKKKPTKKKDRRLKRVNDDGTVTVYDNTRPGRVRTAAEAAAPIEAAKSGKSIPGLPDFEDPTDTDLKNIELTEEQKSSIERPGQAEQDRIREANAADANDEAASYLNSDLFKNPEKYQDLEEDEALSQGMTKAQREDYRRQMGRKPSVNKVVTTNSGAKKVVTSTPKPGFLDGAPDKKPFGQEKLPESKYEVNIPGLDQLRTAADHVGIELGTHSDKVRAKTAFYSADYDQLHRLLSEIHEHISKALAHHVNSGRVNDVLPSTSRLGNDTTSEDSVETARYNAEQAAEKLKTLASGLHSLGTAVATQPLPLSEFETTPTKNLTGGASGSIESVPKVDAPPQWLANEGFGKNVDAALTSYKDHLDSGQRTISDIDTTPFRRPDPNHLVALLKATKDEHLTPENLAVKKVLEKNTELDTDPDSRAKKEAIVGRTLAYRIEEQQADEQQRLAKARFGENQFRDAQWHQERIELMNQGIKVPETPMQVQEADGTMRTLSPREHVEYLKNHETNIRPLAGLRPNDRLQQILRTRRAAAPSFDLTEALKQENAAKAALPASPQPMGPETEARFGKARLQGTIRQTTPRTPREELAGYMGNDLKVSKLSDEEVSQQLAERKAKRDAFTAAETQRIVEKTQGPAIMEGRASDKEMAQQVAENAAKRAAREADLKDLMDRHAAGTASQQDIAELASRQREVLDYKARQNDALLPMIHKHWEIMNPRPTLGENTEAGSYEARMAEWNARKPTDAAKYMEQFPNVEKDLKENDKRERLGARYQEPHTKDEYRNATDHWKVTHPELHNDGERYRTELFASDAYKNPKKYLADNGGNKAVGMMLTKALGPISAGNRGKHPLDWNLSKVGGAQTAPSAPSTRRRSQKAPVAGGAAPRGNVAAEPEVPQFQVKPVSTGRDSIFRAAMEGR